MKKNFVLLILLFFLSKSHAQPGYYTSEEFAAQKNHKKKWEYAFQYTVPGSKTNQLTVINADVFFWTHYFKNAIINISFGLTAQYANGFVTRLQFNGTQFQEMKITDRAYGLGPQAQLQFVIAGINRLSLEGEAAGSLLLLNKKFPVGGSQYNLLFRTGPNLAWNIKNNRLLKIGYRWLHGSNGKGYGDDNPYYEGQGLVLSFTRFL